MRAGIAVASALAVTLLGIAGAIPAAAHHPSVSVLVRAGRRFLARTRPHAARRRR